MDLNDLRSMGVVQDNPLLKRTIPIRYQPMKPKELWADPDVAEFLDEYVDDTFDCWLKKLNAADQILMQHHEGAGIDKQYVMIHRCVFKENGERVFPTIESALGLRLELFAPLLHELLKLNGAYSKNSRPRTKRGANSRSPSADDPSPNGSEPSTPVNGTPGYSTAPSSAH